jgi:hypothetical protein
MASEHVLYGVVIHQAIASGDLVHMKKLAKEAEGYLAKHGDLPSLLEALKVEIAKLEQKNR